MITAAVLASLLFVLAPASAPPHHTEVALELGGLEPIDRGVREELATAIRAAAFDAVRGHAVPPEKIHIELAWQDQNDVDYAIRIHVDAHAGVAASDHPATTGPDATTAGLSDVVAAALDRALDDWTRAHAALSSVRRKPVIAPIVPIRREAAPRARSLGHMGWAGIGVAITGVAGLGGGIGLLALDRTADPHDATRLRDWRPAGWSLVALGSAAIIAGTTMAIIDSRPSRARRPVAVGPWAGRRGAGLALRVGF